MPQTRSGTQLPKQSPSKGSAAGNGLSARQQQASSIESALEQLEMIKDPEEIYSQLETDTMQDLYVSFCRTPFFNEREREQLTHIAQSMRRIEIRNASDGFKTKRFLDQAETIRAQCRGWDLLQNTRATTASTFAPTRESMSGSRR